MQDKKDDLAIVPDTNVLASEFWEMFKDREDVYLPRAVLEEIEFNYLVAKMLSQKSKNIVLIRDGRIMAIQLERLSENEKKIVALIKTRVYPWKETEVDRILDALCLEELKNGRSDRYYELKDLLPRKRHHKTSSTKTPAEDRESTEKELPERESREIKKAFSKASADVYPKILDLISAGKWTLIGSSGSGFKQLIEETFQNYNEGLTGRRENGIGPNDIRILSSALNLAVKSGEKVVLLTNDNHLAMTWQMHEQDVLAKLAKIGKRIHFRIHRLRFKNPN